MRDMETQPAPFYPSALLFQSITLGLNLVYIYMYMLCVP
jgi:hypothetical protein